MKNEMWASNAELIKSVRSALESDGNAFKQFNDAAPSSSAPFDKWYDALRADTAKEEDGARLNNKFGVYAKRYRDAKGWKSPKARKAGGGRKAKAKNPKAAGKVEPSTATPPNATPVQILEQYLAAALMVMEKVEGLSELETVTKAFNSKASAIIKARRAKNQKK